MHQSITQPDTNTKPVVGTDSEIPARPKGGGLRHLVIELEWLPGAGKSRCVDLKV